MVNNKKILIVIASLMLIVISCKSMAVENEVNNTVLVENSIANDVINNIVNNTINNNISNELCLNKIEEEIVEEKKDEEQESSNEEKEEEQEEELKEESTENAPSSPIMPLQTPASIEFYTGVNDEHVRKPNALSGVTEEMCKVEYWKDKTIIDWEEELISFSEISTLNRAIVDGSGTKVFDLTELSITFDADKKRNSLASSAIPTRDLYINGQLINNQTYFGNLISAISSTGYSGVQNIIYAVCSNRTDLKSWPTDDVIGYTATDRDDEMESSALNLNEPFIIYAKCVVDENTYYWGYCNNCTGWVNAKNVAICASRDEWLDYWKINIEENNFIVVTGSKINLQHENLGSIPIMLGTILKLVPDNEIPDELKENLDSNHVVYFAGRDNNGYAVKKYAKIPKNLEINKGFLKLTQKNVLDVAFSCLGDEYGWGGMDGNMDCSMYTRQIYRCFGLELPRNTTWQQKTPQKYVDISKMTDDEKIKYLSTLPAGSLLYFPGHTMVYIGTDENKNFVVSDFGYAADENSSEIQYLYSVNINSMNVKRNNGRTWLNSLTGAIVFANKIDISSCTIITDENNNVLENDLEVPTISVSYNDYVLYRNINYKVEFIENKAENKIDINIVGLNNFTGTYSNFVVPKSYSYKFIENEWANYSAGGVSNYSFRIDGDDKRFESLTIGELNLVRDDDYTVKHGSTIITLTDKGNAKLNTLAPWDYAVRVKYTGIGELVVGKLTLASSGRKSVDSASINENIQKSSNLNTKTEKIVNPETGDNIYIWYSICLVSLVLVLIKNKIYNKTSHES